MNARITPLITAGVLSLAACGGSDGEAADVATPGIATTADAPVNGEEAAGPAAENTVTISRSRFDNTELRVPAGTTVTFVNTDGFDHTVTSRDGSPIEFDSGRLGQDESFEMTFDEPGEFPYFCQIHPTMRAVVIVE